MIWQYIIIALALIASAAYALRRLLRYFRASAHDAPCSCCTACPGCHPKSDSVTPADKCPAPPCDA